MPGVNFIDSFANETKELLKIISGVRATILEIEKERFVEQNEGAVPTLKRSDRMKVEVEISETVYVREATKRVGVESQSLN